MVAEAYSIPNEALFHFVIKHQSTDQLFNSLYDHPSEKIKRHFMEVNSHLGKQVRPGQMIILTPPDTQQCTPLEGELMEAARRVDRQLEALSEEEAKVISEHYALLANVANYSSAGYGIAMNYFKVHKDHVEHILKSIEKLYIETYNHRKFSTEEFFRMRKNLFNQLDMTLKTMVGRGSAGLNFDRRDVKRSLGLSTKGLVHRLKDHPIPISKLPEFEKNHAKVKQYGRVLKGAGYVGLALDGVQSAAKVSEACASGREDECNKTKFSQGGRLVGSIGGGAAGGALAAYGVCNIVLGLETAGTSLLWCAIIVGGAGGFAGGNFFGNEGKKRGEILYENIYRNQQSK